jgi:hypothetical protein
VPDVSFKIIWRLRRGGPVCPPSFLGRIRAGASKYFVRYIRHMILGFGSHKRGIVGTFHKVTKKYLQLYVAEFELRYNNRKNPDIFGAAICLY